MRKIYLLFLLVTLASCSSAEDNSIPLLNSDATSERQIQALSNLLKSPTPKEGMWMYENFAMAAYWLNKETARADDGIIKIENELFPQTINSFEANDFHWHAYILERIYYLFSSKSKHFPGRMSPDAEKAILEMLWSWSEKYCRVELTLAARVWWIWGSENHHLQAWVSFWGAAQIFKNHPQYKDRKYGDGSTPAQMSKAFDDYFNSSFTLGHQKVLWWKLDLRLMQSTRLIRFTILRILQKINYLRNLWTNISISIGQNGQ